MCKYKYNRGEWSELYCVLYLLVNPNIQIVDENLHNVDDAIFTVKEIIVGNNWELKYIISGDKVQIHINGDDIEDTNITLDEIEWARKEMLENIPKPHGGRGSFEIPSINPFMDKFFQGKSAKKGAMIKSDVQMSVGDSIQHQTVNLYYSIKSFLGKPPTLLNASNHTRLLYRINGFDAEKEEIVNKIKKGYKYKKRIKKIIDFGGSIVFEKTLSESFDYNLRLIDPNMPEYLGNALLEAQTVRGKDLRKCFKNGNDFTNDDFVDSKLGDLLEAFSFGAFPSVKWDNERSVDGGILIVKKNGNVVLLDTLYNENSVRKYLVNNTKFDTPSSTTYPVLHIFNEKGKYYFILNSQIRYKSQK